MAYRGHLDRQLQDEDQQKTAETESGTSVVPKTPLSAVTLLFKYLFAFAVGLAFGVAFEKARGMSVQESS